MLENIKSDEFKLLELVYFFAFAFSGAEALGF